MSAKWTQTEDIALTKAYIEGSEDNVVGSNQPKETFWIKIQTIMYDLLDSAGHQCPKRTPDSLASRWKKHIFLKMQKWNEALQRASREVGSGGQIMDEHELALRLYYTEMKHHWCFQHTWEVARDWVIWRAESQASQTTPRTTSQPMEDSNFPTPPQTQFHSEPLGDNDDAETPNVPQSSQRPMGTKKAKQGKGKGKGKTSCSQETILNMERERLLTLRETTSMAEIGRERRHQEMLQQTRLEEAAKKEQNDRDRDDRIMSMDCSSYTPDTKAYWKKKRKEIQQKNLARDLFGGSNHEETDWFQGANQ